ncbi:MAG TPA: 4-(cytidine 5'-diphospho)-2-C-methyl-D-erythritol kinase [Stellaceae bacterium]|jgi:4-diphosphocytidyl-2-C-methyl-D-erythritol kinase|nr:4-(cytidine 5'-diphospho)-2-C-methyl-D-erythritol kinase [Stellaceae bacterium]
MSGAVSVFAPAKINLYLHIVGKRADGYHLLDSLVAFADIGDRVSAVPANGLSLSINGPEAGALAETGDDNLVLRAAKLFAEATGAAGGAALYLEKQLPVSSGIGGGSSDAAAALRALAGLWGRRLDDAALARLALTLGADVPACLIGTAVWVGGIGERLEPVLALPPAGIVLANPRRALPTVQVFKARRGGFTPANRIDPMPGDAAALAAALAENHNDLTDAALHIVPEIADVLAHLAALPGALLTRMSGSGATCFALFTDRAAAAAARRRLVSQKPHWWSAAGALTSAPPGVEPVDAETIQL